MYISIYSSVTGEIWPRLPILLQPTYETRRKFKTEGLVAVFVSRTEKSKGIAFGGGSVCLQRG